MNDVITYSNLLCLTGHRAGIGDNWDTWGISGTLGTDREVAGRLRHTRRLP